MRGLRRELPPSVLAIAAIGVLAFALGLDAAGLTFVTLGVLGAVGVAVGARGRDREQLEDLYGSRVEGADDHALRVAQRRLLAELDDPAQLQGSLRPQLTSLVTARLARRGTSLDDPTTRDLLGEPLWAFVTGPPRTRTLPLRELDALLTRVEAL